MERLGNWNKENFIKIPGYTLPVFLALSLNFPESTATMTLSESFLRINDLSPVMVAANEYADIGIPAKKKLEKGTYNSGFIPLFRLESDLKAELDKRLGGLKTKYGNDAHTANLENVIDDFIFLSRERRSFTVSDTPLYQELDSGIVEAAYITWAFSGIWDYVGFDPAGEVTGVEDLKKKYNVFDLSRNRNNLNQITKKLRGIHAVAMCLKIDDDLEGTHFDGLVGIPNFVFWEEQFENADLKSLRRYYLNIARKAGIPGFITSAAMAASHVRGLIKDRKARNKTLLNETGMFDDFKFGLESNTFRHELEASGFLEEVFRK